MFSWGWKTSTAATSSFTSSRTAPREWSSTSRWGCKELPINIQEGKHIFMNHVQAMEREITKRRQVIELLGQGKKYYDRLRKFWRLMKKSFSTIVFSVCMGRQRSSPLPTAILVRGWKRQEQEREILIFDMPPCFHQSASQVAVKLKEKSEELSSSSSPVPSPDYDAPSPAGSGDYKSNRRITQQNLYECWHTCVSISLSKEKI